MFKLVEFCQRIEDNAFHLHQWWIGFS